MKFDFDVAADYFLFAVCVAAVLVLIVSVCGVARCFGFI